MHCDIINNRALQNLHIICILVSNIAEVFLWTKSGTILSYLWTKTGMK